jgi:hypothetical protein
MTTTISEAATHIEDLIALLDDAYWEASAIESKDLIYNVIHVVQSEYTEINKLSIQDHHMPYEPITKDFREMKHKFSLLRNMMNTVVMRSRTAGALEQLMPKVSALAD